jgi:ribonuclease R|uniref:RNB domain-containing protein n=1 Tax=viral metagenome TaxID=1070528 RepID=A0A6C0IMV2_9ZZZZ
MRNDQYEEYYDRKFMKEYNKYEVKNDNDILKPHMYSIPREKRKVLRNMEVYTIDPEGSKDADDAFSIEKDEETGMLYLYIHISDPTEYIDINSKLWKQISKQAYTLYPSNRAPIHLMPDEILTMSSLKEDKKETKYKNAITLKMCVDNEKNEINKEDVEIFPSIIKIRKENAYTYKEASQLIKSNEIFYLGMKISEKLREERGSYAEKISEVNNAYPVYDKKSKLVKLYLDDEEEVKMKQMIAEFAILANSIVAEYISNNLKEKHNIYRSCELKVEDKQKMKEKNGNEILEYIVSNGVSACYNTIKKSHDLVEKKYYVHFTSPLRRANDCVCHYIVKYIMIKKTNEKVVFPFKKEKIYAIMEYCNEINKKIKKIQYDDTKYRTVHAMDNILYKKTFDNMYKQSVIAIKFKIRSYSGIFLNIHVFKIDQYPVYLMMTFKRQFLNDVKINNLIKQNVTLDGTIRTIFFQESVLDAGKFPELEQFLTRYLE